MHKQALLSHYRLVEKVQPVIVLETGRRSWEVKSCDFNGTAIAMKTMATNHAEIYGSSLSKENETKGRGMGP
jgi:hypothetical protein